MCHQTVSLIARHLETLGIPTMCMGSALDILRAGQPPRATFVDFPLGHTSGKPFDREGRLALVRSALSGLETMSEPGTIHILPDRWDTDDAWKIATLKSDGGGGGDQRKPRNTTPQYQTEEDRILAEKQ